MAKGSQQNAVRLGDSSRGQAGQEENAARRKALRELKKTSPAAPQKPVSASVFDKAFDGQIELNEMTLKRFSHNTPGLFALEHMAEDYKYQRAIVRITHVRRHKDSDQLTSVCAVEMTDGSIEVGEIFVPFYYVEKFTAAQFRPNSGLNPEGQDQQRKLHAFLRACYEAEVKDLASYAQQTSMLSENSGYTHEEPVDEADEAARAYQTDLMAYGPYFESATNNLTQLKAEVVGHYVLGVGHRAVVEVYMAYGKDQPVAKLVFAERGHELHGVVFAGTHVPFFRLRMENLITDKIPEHLRESVAVLHSYLRKVLATVQKTETAPVEQVKASQPMVPVEVVVEKPLYPFQGARYGKPKRGAAPAQQPALLAPKEDSAQKVVSTPTAPAAVVIEPTWDTLVA